jgi:hypothetical protein
MEIDCGGHKRTAVINTSVAERLLEISAGHRQQGGVCNRAQKQRASRGSTPWKKIDHLRARPRPALIRRAA